MRWSDNVFFYPWVGCDYESGFINSDGVSQRLLIVGESAYDDNSHGDRDPRHYICDAICNFLKPKNERDWSPSRYWAVIGNTIVGNNADHESELWDRVAYCVFSQKFAGDSPRQRPNLETWKASYEPFIEIVQALRPEKILVIGKENWSHVKQAVSEEYGEEGFAPRMTYIYHPSAPGGVFSYDRCVPIVKAFLDE